MAIKDYLNKIPNPLDQLDFSNYQNVFLGQRPESVDELASLGLLGKNPTEVIDKANKASFTQGLLNMGINYLATPKNKNYGSALPYFLQAYQKGVEGAQTPYKTLISDVTDKEKLVAFKRGKDKSDREEALRVQLLNEPKLTEMEKGQINADPVGFANERNKKSAPSYLDEKIMDLTAKQKLDPNNFTAQDEIDLKTAINLKVSGSQDVLGSGSLFAPQTEAQEKGRVKGAQEAATEAVKWMNGGNADFAGQMIKLDNAINMLESGDDNISGNIYGAAPRFAQRMAFKEGTIVQDSVEEVIARSLRETLGAQFTANEGMLLLARGYDPYATEQENARRVRALRSVMEATAKRKQAMADHYQTYGSLEKYKYKPVTFEELRDALPPPSKRRAKEMDERIAAMKEQSKTPEGMLLNPQDTAILNSYGFGN